MNCVHRFFQTSLVLAMFFLAAAQGFAADEAGTTTWKAGVAAADITPEYSMWMAGYAARTKPAEGKLQSLYAKALALEDPAGNKLVLITTDLVGMRASFTNAIAEELRQKHGLGRDRLMFTSSHTHCGPLLGESLESSVYYPVTAEQAEKVRRYSKKLRGQIIDVVDRAIADLKTARLRSGMGKATFAVNRREPTAKGIINGNNPKGPVDHSVPVLCVESGDGKLQAIAFGYACHNTTLSFYLWCGDYAGFAQEYLEKAHPGATALFFMGCGGDANPLPRQTVELCRKYGRQLADAVESVLQGEMRPISGQARFAFEKVDLPLDKLPTRDELEEQAKGKPSYKQRRALKLLHTLQTQGKLNTTYPYPIHVWRLGPELTWIALGGEAVVDFSHRLKRELGSGTWVAAYANDVMAYIPSRRVLDEGGYEATITSGELAGTRWGPQVEELIIAKAHRLVDQVRGVKKPQ
jgi:hypothetical protein